MENDPRITDGQAGRLPWTQPRLETLEVARTRSGAAVFNEDLVTETTPPS